MKRARMPGDETGQCAVTDCRPLTRRTKQAGVDLFAERHNLAFHDALIAASLCLRVVTSYGRRTCMKGWPSRGD